MTLEQDIKLSSEAFKTAANEMSALKTRAETLKTTLEHFYRGFVLRIKKIPGL